jgi:hypothetical protein
VITTGTDIDLGYPALGKAVAFLQKPYNDSELIEALVEWAVPALLASRDLTGHIMIFRDFDWTGNLKLVNVATFHNLTIYRPRMISYDK